MIDVDYESPQNITAWKLLAYSDTNPSWARLNIYLVCPILNWKPISAECLLNNSTKEQIKIES